MYFLSHLLILLARSTICPTVCGPSFTHLSPGISDLDMPPRLYYQLHPNTCCKSQCPVIKLQFQGNNSTKEFKGSNLHYSAISLVTHVYTFFPTLHTLYQEACKDCELPSQHLLARNFQHTASWSFRRSFSTTTLGTPLIRQQRYPTASGKFIRGIPGPGGKRPRSTGLSRLVLSAYKNKGSSTEKWL